VTFISGSNACFASIARLCVATRGDGSARTLPTRLSSEVFVVAWRRIAEVPEDALPWLLGCARRVIANQRRGAGRRQALTERLCQVHPLEGSDSSGPGRRLRQALSALSERDREVLMLVAWEDLSPADAARVIGCSERAFAMRLHRARRRLGAELDKRSVSHEATAR
jgi:RNA polymerase sigma-70 factor (ECF subfamily)